MTDSMQAGDQAGVGQETATDPAIEGTQGTTVASDQITDSGTGGTADESFFDPQSIPDELQPAYKQMQGAWTKKMQEVSANQKKIDAYNSFEQNPMDTLKQLSQQYGYSLVQGEQPKAQNGENLEFESWEQVIQTAEEKAEQRILKKLEPLIGKVSELQQQNTESYLDNNYSDWRMYEDKMVDIVKQHPTLAKDPDMLYEMAIPKNIRQARATKSALSTIQSQAGAAQVSGGSSTTKKPTSKPEGSLSLDEAVEVARAQLASKGMKGP